MYCEVILLDEIIINQVSQSEISELALCVLRRYQHLFPDWDIIFFSIPQSKEKTKHIRYSIDFLTKLLEYDMGARQN